MYKTLKKFGALLLAVVMLLALSTTAFADDTNLTEDKDLTDGTTVISDQGVLQNGTDNGSGTAASYTAVSNTVIIEKDIIVFNSDSKTVYHPNISYTYTISQVGTEATVIAGATVNDEYNKTAYVLGSVMGAVTGGTTATVDFTDAGTVATSTAGAKIKNTFSFSFTPSSFPHAGIYRYLITETEAKTADNTLTRTNAGVISGASYVATRYLDVYVMNTDSGLAIYGYVLYQGSNSDAFNAGTGRTLPITSKTNGYVVNNESDLTDTTNCDYYWTVNLQVKKLVDGQLGDKQNEFDFSVVLGGQPANFKKADYTTYDSSEAANDTTHTGTTSSNNATVTTVLAHNDTITFVGLPMATTATVTETNNTYDTYTASAAHDNDATLTVNGTATANLIKDAPGTVTALTVYNKDGNVTPVSSGQIAASAVDKSIDTITVTNDLSAVSPTGVVLRVAPYVLILGAGFIFLAIAKRRKEEADEA